MDDCSLILKSNYMDPAVVGAFEHSLMNVEPKVRAQFLDLTIRAFGANLLANPTEPRGILKLRWTPMVVF